MAEAFIPSHYRNFEQAVENMADAFGNSIIALLPNLRRYAISLARSREIADDLVQITCEKAFAARASFDPASKLDAWLFRILRNSWIDMARRRKTMGIEIDAADAGSLLTIDGAAEVEGKLMLHSVFDAIMKLPDEQRDVLIIVCVEEFSYREAADLLEIPIGTLMSRLARARLALAKQVGIK